MDSEPEGPGGVEQRPGEAGRPRPRREPMRRYYGGADAYGRRRLMAGIAIAAVILILILLVASC